MDRTRNIFAWLGSKEEQSILTLALKHVEKSLECVLAMKAAIESVIKNNMEERDSNINIVKNAEHKGDEIKKEIMTELSKGMFLPPDREDLILLNESLNDIADSAKGVVRLLEFFDREPSENLDRLMLESSLIAVKAGEKLKSAINYLVQSNGEKILAECAGIETLEKEGDDKRRDLIKELIKTDLPPQISILVYEIIDNLEDVTDYIKKAGDMVRLLAIKAR